MVRIAKDLGFGMGHFESDQDAIVIYSYRDKYGGSNTKDYSILLCQSGETTAWYSEHQLSFIKHVGDDGIKAVTSDKEKREAQQTSLEWIVKEWPSIHDNIPRSTMEHLMRLVGITNPWGPNGEGIEYGYNACLAFEILNPILMTGDISQVREFFRASVSRK